MSYLTLPSINLADFSKGTISLWFRFSQDAVDKAKAHGNNYQNPFHPEAPDIFVYTIPLVTFGHKVMAHVYDSKSVQVGTTPPSFDAFGNMTPGVPVMVPQVDDKGDAACEPSYLGINCADDKVSLIMHFQTATRAVVQGLRHQIVEVHYDLNQRYETKEDISYIQTAQPESFLINPKFEVETDKWHHLLVSFDFSRSIDVVAAEVDNTGSFDEASELAATIKSYCRIWYAFDDENKNGKDNMGDSWVPQDENGIVPQTAKDAAFVYVPVPPSPFVTGENQNPEYHWAASPISVNGGPVGLPASSEYVDTIYHCEMAEFQMWAGVTLDTDNLSQRRAFVDADGKPVKPAEAATLMGKRPDILLHGSSKWQIGYNTGSTGVEIETDSGGNETLTDLPGGQFTPVAGIEKYKPEPKLGTG